MKRWKTAVPVSRPERSESAAGSSTAATAVARNGEVLIFFLQVQEARAKPKPLIVVYSPTMALTETKMGSFLRLVRREAYPFLAQRASFSAFFSVYRAEKLTGH